MRQLQVFLINCVHKQTKNKRNETIKKKQATSEADQLLAKRAGLQKRLDETMAKIRELGSMPSAYQQYQATALKALYSQLHACQKKLKAYSHVNQKALDQFVSFSEQREKFLVRKKEQDDADVSIQDLIKVLDGQKEEAILRTFKQVCTSVVNI